MLIDPGNAEKSELVARVSRRGPGQMPRLATNRVDKKAVEILRRWIADMLFFAECDVLVAVTSPSLDLSLIHI